MAIFKSKWWKVVVCILVAVLVDVILHVLFVPRNSYNYQPSIFAEKGLILPAATIMLVILFTVIAVVFVLIQKRLPGTKTMKGWRHGIAFGILTFVSIIEVNLIFDCSLINELRGSISDGVSILLMALMLSRIMGTDNQITGQDVKFRWKPFVLIPLFFLGGRYFGYAIVHILSAYIQKPWATFLWTLGIGLWLSVMYQLLREAGNDIPAVARAIRFGGLVFGSFWLIYILFMLVYVQVSVLDLFVRFMIDVVFVTIGIWLVEAIEHRAALKN
jgi:hypothetical protein